MASPADAPAQTASLAEQPATSNADDGFSRRPRDARLIHLVLSSLGIHSYQERVPLQLLDFAYRYTSSVLSDALRLSAEGYTAAPGTTASGRRGGGNDAAAAAAAAAAAGAGGASASDGGNVSVAALRQAIASRQDYQFAAPLPKEFMLEQAADKNRVQLPRVERAWGVQLPAERYCLTGTGWGIKDEWESEGDEEGDDEEGDDEEGDGAHGLANGTAAQAATGVNGDGNVDMGGMDGAAAEDEDEEGAGTFEDVFGEGEQDREMGDA